MKRIERINSVGLDTKRTADLPIYKNKNRETSMMVGRVWITAENILKIATETGRHRKTVEKWYRTRSLPFAIERLLNILHNGCLGEVHRDWRGFSIDTRTGRLYLPDGKSVSAGEIMSVPYRYHELGALKAKLRQLDDEASLSPESSTFGNEIENTL